MSKYLPILYTMLSVVFTDKSSFRTFLAVINQLRKPSEHSYFSITSTLNHHNISQGHRCIYYCHRNQYHESILSRDKQPDAEKQTM